MRADGEKFLFGGGRAVKKLSTYLPSLIISAVLVFFIIGSALAITVKINVNADKSIALSVENNISETVSGELEKYFSGQYNTTGIPPEVYAEATDMEYIKNVMDIYTNALFDSLESGTAVDVEIPENKPLESSIEDFFNDYAESIGYEKDGNFDRKVRETIDNAYSVIGNYCDVYKYSALQKHGVISQISKIFSRLGIISVVVVGGAFFLLFILLLINRRNVSVCLYWLGVSSVIAGLFGSVPCIWLTSSGFFDSFIIKQPQVFKAFTGAMYALSRAFLSVHIAILLTGVCFAVIYAVTLKMRKEK